jgi:hypothetical protein
MKYTLSNTKYDIDETFRHVTLFSRTGRELLVVAMNDQRVLYCNSEHSPSHLRGLLIALMEDGGDLDVLGGGDMFSDHWLEWVTGLRDNLQDEALALKHVGDNPFFSQEEILLLAKWEKQLMRIIRDMENQLRLPEYE